jgi:hypothetical protein
MLLLRFLPRIIASMRTVLVDRTLPRSGSGQTNCEKEPIARQRVTSSASHTGSSWSKVVPLLRFAAAMSARMKCSGLLLQELQRSASELWHNAAA